MVAATMSNVFTSSPKSVSATSSIPRLRGASGGDREGLLQPRTNGIRPSASYGNVPGVAIAIASATSTIVPNPGPGSFGSSLRSTATAVITPSNLAGPGDIPSPTSPLSSERLVEELTDQLNRAIKYKEGAENLLQVLDSKKIKEAKQARNQAEKEYNARNMEITQLKTQIEAITKPKDIPRRGQQQQREGNKFQGTPIRAEEVNGLPVAGAPEEWDQGSESPTITLTELLRGLEEKEKRPEYYVEKANSLVMLFKRHPNLKYELEWSTFGNRVQFMLLHEAKEVVAAGYRVTRYAITGLRSLKNIRSLRTDYITIGLVRQKHLCLKPCSLSEVLIYFPPYLSSSLIKDSRANVEREQALKFVRAFIEVPGGVGEISRGIVRGIVACAEQQDDRLRGISMETLAEIRKSLTHNLPIFTSHCPLLTNPGCRVVILDPSLVVAAGGVRILTQVLSDGPYELSDTISLAFLYLLDMPASRKYIRPGNDIEVSASDQSAFIYPIYLVLIPGEGCLFSVYGLLFCQSPRPRGEVEVERKGDQLHVEVMAR